MHAWRNVKECVENGRKANLTSSTFQKVITHNRTNPLTLYREMMDMSSFEMISDAWICIVNQIWRLKISKR